MTSKRQLIANRDNALNSCGPKTGKGKLRSRQNAVRHGLAAQTVIGVLERVEDYENFAAAIAADYVPNAAVERELVSRLASLLWRLRRATAVETGLLEIQKKLIDGKATGPIPGIIYRIFGSDLTSSSETTSPLALHQRLNNPNGFGSDQSEAHTIDIARSFMRLSNVGGQIFDRVGRYEKMLWRQVVEILVALHKAKAPFGST